MNYLGDLTVVAEHYPSMLDYIQNLQSQVAAAGGLVNWPTPYGDWVPPNNTLKVAGMTVFINFPASFYRTVHFGLQLPCDDRSSLCFF